MNFDVLFRYFVTSLEATKMEASDIYLAVANTAVWASALDEALSQAPDARVNYKSARDADEAGRVVLGLRLARNGFIHGEQFAIEAQGLDYPLSYPLSFGPLRWKRYEDLTRTWTPKVREPLLSAMRISYEDEVAGELAIDPLVRAHRWFAQVQEQGWEALR